jgi:hypothetical protein
MHYVYDRSEEENSSMVKSLKTTKYSMSMSALSSAVAPPADLPRARQPLQPATSYSEYFSNIDEEDDGGIFF